MPQMAVPFSSTVALFLALATLTAVHSIGVNYGTLGDNLPPPAQVAAFIKDKTIIDRVKIFDANPDILRAFANTGIFVAVTVPNGLIPNLVDINTARGWVADNIKPFHPQTKINYILVGNEILHWGPQNLRDNLVAAMQTLHQALQLEGINDISVTTAHSLAILEPSDLPGMARFRAGWDRGILEPMLRFHRDTKSPFMVNPYPYFAYSPAKADMCLFRPNPGVHDELIRRDYDNMLDIQLDSVYISMMRLGYGDVEIALGETGWASQGEIFEQPKCSVENAASYNGGLIKKLNARLGTPFFPRRKVESAYIFALFNENQKTGSLAERNFGLFKPDFTPVYDVGILKGPPPPKTIGPIPEKPVPGGGGEKKWCVAKPGISNAALQKNLDWVCSQVDMDCKPIQEGGACFLPNTIAAHASFAMNSYYQANGRNNINCDFAGTGLVTTINPSSGGCQYLS